MTTKVEHAGIRALDTNEIEAVAGGVMDPKPPVKLAAPHPGSTDGSGSGSTNGPYDPINDPWLQHFKNTQL